jgi:integrase
MPAISCNQAALGIGDGDASGGIGVEKLHALAGEGVGEGGEQVAEGQGEGVPCASLHSFRRSMATHLQGEGLNLADIASVTGHKDLASLSHYLDADGDRATAALERIAARVR